MLKLTSIAFILFIFFSCTSRHFQEGSAIGSAIFGGDGVQEGGWPSVVAIDLNDEGTDHCSGVLISDDEVLTAAHCITETPQLLALAQGLVESTTFKISLGNGSDGIYHGRYQISNIKIHPYFNRKKYNRYDFAYIKLARPVKGVEIIPPIFASEIKSVLKYGHSVTLVGFGRRENGHIGSKYVVETSYNWQVKTEIMVGGHGKSACNGDSGGPVFVRLENGQYRLLGITSRGQTTMFGVPLCAKEATYGKVTIATNWLEAENLLEEAQHIDDLMVKNEKLAQFIERLPNDSRGYFLRGESFYGQGQLDLAVADFYQVLRLDPSNERATAFLRMLTGQAGRQQFYLNRGIGNLFIGEFQFAQDDFLKALNEGESGQIYYWLGELFATCPEHDWSKALDYYDLAVELSVGESRYYYSRALVYIVKSKYEDALRDLEKVTVLSPRFGQAYFEMARVNVTMGYFSAAQASLEKAIELGADVDATDLRGLSALMLMSSSKYFSLVQLLIEAGANVNVEGFFRESPLHLAIQAENYDLVKNLIEVGADLEHFDEYGYRALHLAAYRGNLELVTLLVQAKADIGAVTKFRQTALDLALQEGHDDVVEYLQSPNR